MRFWILPLCLACAPEAAAQRFIHDADRDTTAQQAAAAAKQVTSGSLFETMLRNVDAQAKLEVDIELAFVQERMRAKLNALSTWHDPTADPPIPGTPGFVDNLKKCPQSVECVLRGLRDKHAAALAAPVGPADIKDRLAALELKQAELQKRLKALREANTSRDPRVIRAFSALEDPGKDFLAYAKEIAKVAEQHSESVKGVLKALDAVGDGLDQVLAIYHAIEGIWRGQKAVSVDPISLRPPPEQTDLQLLAVEQDHLKVLARIEARKQLEVGAALAGVDTALARLAAAQVPSAPDTIEASLKRAAASPGRAQLFMMLSALHEAVAALAQMDASSGLAALRASDEERRYSIRRSAVNARTYDLTIQAAAERLGLYWKSGIKPGEIAQFAFYLANTIAVPAIALKQE